MKEQLTLGTGFEKYSKTTRREKFLTEMDRIVPWGKLCALIAPVYPKAGDGRPPKELEMMLRVYFLQQWFNLSDPGVEESPLRLGVDAPLCGYRPRRDAGAG
jgi:IS5 family transposase